MNSIAKKRGGRCLSSKYVNSHHPLKWQCKEGHRWLAKPYTVKQGSWCIVCAGKKKKTISDMHALAKSKNGKCLSKIYRNTKTKVNWQCERNHKWSATPSDIIQGKWCPRCSIESNASKLRLTIEEMKTVSTERGGRCLSSSYKNSQTHLEWECKSKHRWFATPGHIKQGKWCPYCAQVKKLSIVDCRAAAKSRGGRCISTEYHGNKSYMVWECSQGHRWRAKYNYIQQGNWCPKCKMSTSYPELLLYSELKRLFPKTEHRKKHFGLESDIFVPDLNLSIEVDGGHWHKEKHKADLKKFKILTANNVRAMNVRQIGLKKISAFDVPFKRVFNDLELVHSTIAMIQQIGLGKVQAETMLTYLNGGALRNQHLLSRLLKQLPGPVEGKSLAELSPQVASELAIRGNGGVQPNMLHNGSHRKVWWVCKKGHPNYLAVVKSRTLAGHGCPICGKESSIAARSKSLKVFKGRNLIGIFSSISKAAKALGLASAAIAKHMKAKSAHRDGYRFRLVSN
jgi:hypothetical protein